MNKMRFPIALAVLALIATSCAQETLAGGSRVSGPATDAPAANAPAAGAPQPAGESSEPASDPLARITVAEPADGATVSGTITVRGEASVYEGTVVLRLRDPDGDVRLTTFTTASEGAPGRGTWSTEIEMPATPSGTWTIEAVEESADDGSDAFVTTRRVQVG